MEEFLSLGQNRGLLEITIGTEVTGPILTAPRIARHITPLADGFVLAHPSLVIGEFHSGSDVKLQSSQW